MLYFLLKDAQLNFVERLSPISKVGLIESVIVYILHLIANVSLKYKGLKFYKFYFKF